MLEKIWAWVPYGCALYGNWNNKTKRGSEFISADLIRSLLSQIEGARDKHGHPIDNNIVVMKVRELVDG